MGGVVGRRAGSALAAPGEAAGAALAWASVSEIVGRWRRHDRTQFDGHDGRARIQLRFGAWTCERQPDRGVRGGDERRRQRPPDRPVCHGVRSDWIPTRPILSRPAARRSFISAITSP